jgi:hypothetical protein
MLNLNTSKNRKKVLFWIACGAGTAGLFCGGGWALFFFRCILVAAEIETGFLIGAGILGSISIGAGVGNSFIPDPEDNSSN